MSAEPSKSLHFGRYQTLFPIATGGMAEVYAARAHGEAGFQKLVALKRMKPELAENARFVTMFLDEGRMAANISSPNVVSTLDLGRADDNSLFLVMELVTGVSLAALLQELTLRHERIPVEIAAEIIAQAANGLHDAHEALAPTGEPMGIVHRDCSPHNVLVDVGGQVKITDFGIAKAMERQTQSQAGEMKGKLTYLSPEQARGYPVDRRCDVFILGVVAWELIAQRRLFNASSAVEVLHKVVAMPIPRLDTLRSDVPEGIADAVEQALQRDPDERFSTAAAFGHALHYTLGDTRPRRSTVGAFVRSHGGPALQDMERRIRETFGTPSRPPLASPSLPAYPIPLAAVLPSPRPFDSHAIEPSEPELPAVNAARSPPRLDRTALLDPLDGATIMDMPPTELEEPPDTIPTKALKGVRIELGPPPDPSAPPSHTQAAPAPLPTLPPSRSITLLVVFAATVVAVGGGIGAAWLLRGDPAGPATPTPASTAASTGALPPEPARAPTEVAPEHPLAPPPPTTPAERIEALEALRSPEVEPDPEPPAPRPRRRRRGVHPRNVTGDEIPSGDRQAAFDEIPW